MQPSPNRTGAFWSNTFLLGSALFLVLVAVSWLAWPRFAERQLQRHIQDLQAIVEKCRAQIPVVQEQLAVSPTERRREALELLTSNVTRTSAAISQAQSDMAAMKQARLRRQPAGLAASAAAVLAILAWALPWSKIAKLAG